MKNTKWFTLVEIVVTLTIIVLLSSISFLSYSSYISNARNSKRTTDLAQLSAALEAYRQETKTLPTPSSKTIFWNFTQGNFDGNVKITTLTNIPTDPKVEKQFYIYSVVNKALDNTISEYQLSATMEGKDYDYAFVLWDYKPASKELPSIIYAGEAWYFVTNTWNNGKWSSVDGENLAYQLKWTAVNWVFAAKKVTNTVPVITVKYDFQTCWDLRNAWKFIWAMNYFINWTQTSCNTTN